MNFNFISKTALFRGCSTDEIKNIAGALNFRTVKYQKENIILNEGSIITDIGIVLSGSVRIEHNDILGNKTILSIVNSGGIFAEAYACIPNEPLIINVVSNEDCEILFVSIPKLFLPCSTGNSQNRIIQNLITISAQKNLLLSKRSLHTSPKTIRERLISYFSQEMSVQGSTKITIPFDRQQFADYLNLDRSALSKELSKMKKDGLIDYKKNTFEIKIGI